MRNEIVRVKFLSATPKFAYILNTLHGKRIVEVGPFCEGDEVGVPKKIAGILKEKKRVNII